MDTNIGVSIVMPAYNSERFIKEAIESVLSQTYSKWELIVIDDASRDKTGEIVQSYCDERIRLIRNETNHGAAYNRNLGAKEAKYNRLAFLDSDDMWLPDKLERQLERSAETPGAKLLFTGSSFIEENGTKLSYCLHVPERITRKELLKQNLISCSSVMVDRELFLRHPMPEMQNIHEDFACWLSILNEEKYAYGIDEPLLIYRIQRGSKSGNKAESAKMQWRTYKVAGEKTLSSAVNMASYAIRGINKYKSIKESEQ